MSTTLRVSVAAVALAITATPIAWALWPRSEPDELAALVRGIGFEPVSPPSTLRGPGTIYLIPKDGSSIAPLCTVESERLDKIMRKSQTEERVSSALRNASVKLDASFGGRARAGAEAQLQQRIAYTLDDVEVHEVSLEDLAIIAGELMSRPHCASQIEMFLRAGDFVCQGQEVFRASASYTASSDRSAATNAETEALHAAIKAHVDPSASVKDTLKVAGQALYYGMKLARGCLAFPGEVPRHPPLTWSDRTLNLIGHY
jgi:hypothetical protein